MSTQLVRTIGRATITITADGCVDCGTHRSPWWMDERRHQIIIGTRSEFITLKRCAECCEKRGAQPVFEAPTALQRRFEVRR